jgi:hypothetical protein
MIETYIHLPRWEPPVGIPVQHTMIEDHTPKPTKKEKKFVIESESSLTESKDESSLNESEDDGFETPKALKKKPPISLSDEGSMFTNIDFADQESTIEESEKESDNELAERDEGDDKFYEIKNKARPSDKQDVQFKVIDLTKVKKTAKDKTAKDKRSFRKEVQEERALVAKDEIQIVKLTVLRGDSRRTR